MFGYRSLITIGAAMLSSCGCAKPYYAVVAPTPRLALLSPELANLTEASIETYLKANVQARFPTVLAVAKVAATGPGVYYRSERNASALQLQVLQGDEADGWHKMTEVRDKVNEPLITQVHFVSPMLVSGTANLKSLRDAAALVHAPLLLVYMESDDARDGYNEAAIAYWSIVGLFVVPGNTVGRYSVCQAVLVDTQSGFILATAQGESKREENVLPGAVDIARDRLQKTTPAEAAARLQDMIRKTIQELAAVKTAKQ